MITRSAAAALTGVLMAGGIAVAPAQAADPCRPGSEVRAMVAAFVAGLHDDVRSERARAATRTALVESMRTFRGQRADTPAERRGLGEQVSALAKRQRETSNPVEKRALATAVLALVEQKERGRFTPGEQQQLRDSIAALRRVLVSRADSAAEGAELAAAIRELVQQFTCSPA